MRRAAILALLLAVAACEAPGSPPATHRTVFMPGDSLQQVQPSDVAVLPVRNQSGTPDAPVGALRETLYTGIIDRLYSPVELGYVDAHWSEAAASPTSMGADALLQVIVTAWDDALLETNHALLVEAEVSLLDPTASRRIWGVTVARRLELKQEQVLHPLRGDLFDRAAEILGEEILGLIPERDPLAEAR